MTVISLAASRPNRKDRMNGEDLHMSDCLKTDSYLMGLRCIKAALLSCDETLV